MKWLRRIGIVLAGLVALVVVTLVVLFFVGGRRMGRVVTAEAMPLAIESDSLSLAEGARLARIYGCRTCHGARLEGAVMIDDPVLGRVVAPHIAPGAGSVTTDFDDADWVRAIRHGIGGDGRPLLIMPATDFVKILSAEDLADIIAYVRHGEPVDHDPGRSALRLGQVLLGAGMFWFEYDRIDHSTPPATKPAADDTLAFGRYLGGICRTCHGENLMGNEEFGGTPLARGGLLEAYDEQSFAAFFRSGRTPGGRMIDSLKMPWHELGAMNEAEMAAVWRYLRSVPASEP